MAISEEGGGLPATMLVGPTGYGGGNGSFGFGGDWAWILLLLVLFGGWNNGGGFGMDGIYPWMNQSNLISGGFQNAALGDQLTGISSAINSNAIANLERSFAAQTAATQGVFDLSSQLAQCCCENRLATANLNSTILAENCADRAALADGIRDIIANQTAATQRILDMMCSDKIDAKNDEIARLRQEVYMKDLAASQAAQNNFLLSYIAPRPTPESTVTPAVF